MSSRREFLAVLARLLPLGVVGTRAVPAATLMRHPYLQSVSRTSATIVWTTIEEGSGSVRYSTDRNLTRQRASTVRELDPEETQLGYAYFRHRVEITDLREDTRYYYRIFHNNEALTPGEDLSFRTPSPGPFSFFAFGDSGWGGVEQYQLAAHMAKEPAALAIHTGDIAYPNATFQEFETRHFAVYREIFKRIPFFPCPGNHEYYTFNGAPYRTVFEVPKAGVPQAGQGLYYSFDWGPVHFVSLDSNQPLVDASRGRGPMLQWLDSDLAQTKLPWKIVYFHHPPYAWGPNQDDPNAALARQHIVPILERHGVQLVLNGHEHSYQRSCPIRAGRRAGEFEGIVYLTTGGGGGPLYEVYRNSLQEAGASIYHYLRLEVDGVRIRAQAIGMDGKPFDEVVISRPPQLANGGVVNAVPEVEGIAAGGLASIFGVHLAARIESASGPELPLSLGGARVFVNAVPAPILYASPSQINVQIPPELHGEVEVRVETVAGSGSAPAFIAEAAPGILGVLRSETEAITEETPVKPGQTLTAVAAGLGARERQATVNLLFDSTIVAPVSVRSVWPGVYMISFRIPADCAPGRRRLQLEVSGATSNAVWILVDG